MLQWLWIGLGLAVALAGCWSDRAKPEQQGPPIARLERTRGEVQFRVGGSLRWDSATSGQGLRAQDAVKTGVRASAGVSYLNGARLELGEQTLVIIQVLQNKAEGQTVRWGARIEKGTARGVLRPGARLEVVGPNGERSVISATSQPVRLRLRAQKSGAIEFASLEGAAQVAIGGKVVEIAPRQAVSLRAKSLARVESLPGYPELELPAIDARLGAGEVRFRWRPVPGATRYRLQLARSVEFREIVGEAENDAPNWASARLGPGAYAWRVCAVTRSGLEGEYGFARRFVVAVGTVPSPIAKPVAVATQLVLPAPGAEIATAKPEGVVSFRWRPQTGAEGYLLVVSTDSTLGAPFTKRARIAGTRAGLRLAWGRYFWGVYALESGGKERAMFERPRLLRVSRRRPPRVKVPGALERWR